MRVSTELETRANLLRKEALQCLTVSLAGSDTKGLWDLLTAYFGANHTGDEEDPWDFLDAAPEIPPPLPVTDTDSDDDKASLTSTATTRSAPAAPASRAPVGVGAKAKGRAKVVMQKDQLDDLCVAERAIRIYPSSKDTLSETGIPEHLLAPREQVTTAKGGSMYLCRHELCKEGPYFAQSTAGLYSHVRRKHLGMVVACPYCPKKLYWNTKGWATHMDRYHADVPHYGHEVTNEPELAAALLSQVKADPDALQTQARKQEKRLRKGLHPTKKTPTVTMKEEVTSTVPSQPDESSESDDEDYEPPSDTVDSPSDSTSNSDTDTDSDHDKGQGQAASHERESLTFEQLQAVREGATTLRGQPTLEALQKYPSAWKWKPSSHMASRDAPPSATPAAQLAASMMMMDVPPSTGDPPGDLDDMPELEETPPPPFPKKRRTDDEN